MAVIKTWNATALTGGAVRALDAIPVASLTDGDRAFIALSSVLYYHKFNSSATDAEDAPQKIRPDDYSTAGVWELQQIYGVRQNLPSDTTITVGGAGDYATINEAIDFAVSTYMPEYLKTGVTVTISLLAGFVMAEQVLVYGLNLGWITIVGADATTTITRSLLTINFGTSSGSAFSSYPAFGVTGGGTLPRISQQFTMDSSGSSSSRDGVFLIGAGNSIDIRSGGVSDAPQYGIGVLSGSSALIEDGDFTGCGFGVFAFNSMVNAASVDVSGAVTYGVRASGSLVDVNSCDASGSSGVGISAVEASQVNAANADVSGAGTFGVRSEGSSAVNAFGATGTGAGTNGYGVLNGATINAGTATGTLSQTANTVTAAGIIFQ